MGYVLFSLQLTDQHFAKHRSFLEEKYGKASYFFSLERTFKPTVFIFSKSF